MDSIVIEDRNEMAIPPFLYNPLLIVNTICNSTNMEDWTIPEALGLKRDCRSYTCRKTFVQRKLQRRNPVCFIENSTDFQFTSLTGIVEINVELTNRSDVHETLGSLKRVFSSDRCNNDEEYPLTEYLYKNENTDRICKSTVQLWKWLYVDGSFLFSFDL